MGCTACTEPQCLYKGALYLFLCCVKLALFNNTVNRNIFIEDITAELVRLFGPNVLKYKALHFRDRFSSCLKASSKTVYIT
jgi:hypothetical protein